MSYVQTIGWDDYFVPPALQLFSEGCYFIFNCGENSQRFRLSNKLGLAKIRYILLTNLSAHSFNGLPSFILSLDGCNTPQVTVFGPNPIKKVLDKLLDTFHELKIRVEVHEIDSTEKKQLIKLNSVTISAFIYQSKSNCDFTIKPIQDVNVAYLIEFDDVPGIFNPELARQYGVPKGPDYGRLKKGFDVTLSDGSILRSNQVCQDPIQGNQILILDGKEDMNLMNKLEFDENRLVYTFYLHTGNSEVSKNEVGCNKTSEESTYVAIHSFYERNQIHHSILPPLFPSLTSFKLNRSTSQLSQLSHESLSPNSSNKEHMYDHPPLTKFFVHPPKKVTTDYSDCLRKELNVESYNHETVELDISLDGPKITFLGTGCSVPSVYRNVSAILVQIYENHSILLDAGEGTVLQILYTCKNFDEFVQKLLSIKVVFISHSHADHHLGLYYILALQKKFKHDGSETLVVCSDVVMTWLKTYNENICKLDFKCMVLSEDTETLLPFDKSTVELSFFKVDHIFDSFGIKITHEEIGTVVYSGDTRPCENLVFHAQNADVLIHEATFTDDYSENAVKNFHTTISEAVDIGRSSWNDRHLGTRCNVRNLFVTHFSQRFQTIPNEYNLDFNLIMALDLMTVPIRQLDELEAPLKRFNMILKSLIE